MGSGRTRPLGLTGYFQPKLPVTIAVQISIVTDPNAVFCLILRPARDGSLNEAHPSALSRPISGAVVELGAGSRLGDNFCDKLVNLTTSSKLRDEKAS